jgi:transcriptional regulator with XRE-family HTH domain
MRQASSARRQLLGRMLRTYREAQDYKLEEAARILDCDRSKISRIETGERGIRVKELRELPSEYGIDEVTQDTPIRPPSWKGGTRRTSGSSSARLPCTSKSAARG